MREDCVLGIAFRLQFHAVFTKHENKRCLDMGPRFRSITSGILCSLVDESHATNNILKDPPAPFKRYDKLAAAWLSKYFL